MIEEAYCSFETARLLREKGDAPIGKFILPQGENIVVGDDLISPVYIGPTIQTTKIGKLEIKYCNIDKYE